MQKFIIIEKGEYRDFFCLGKITMKKYSREQLKKRLIVSIVLGVIMTLALLIPAMFSGSEQLWYAAIMIPAGLVLLPISILGMSFNFGKIMLGIIAPIPVLSSVIESFKSIVYAIKGIIVLVKKQDYLVIGKETEETDG